MRIINLTLLLFILSTFYSCSPVKDFGGKYRSYGYGKTSIFFNIQLDFKRDSTFDFKMSFDLMGDHATGHYNIQGQYINLVYDADKTDSSITSHLTSQNKNGRITCLYIGNNKLFKCDSKGKVFRVYPDGFRYYFKKGSFD